MFTRARRSFYYLIDGGTPPATQYNTYIRVDGVWKRAAGVYERVDGVWKTVAPGASSVRVDGVWKAEVTT